MTPSAACALLSSVRTARLCTKPLNKYIINRNISCSSTTNSSEGIEPPNIQRLAELAQIGVSEKEAAEWAPNIAKIVDWFGQLQQVDLEGVPPALRAEIEDGNSFRPDHAHPFEDRNIMIDQMPLRNGHFLKVPKMNASEAE